MYCIDLNSIYRPTSSVNLFDLSSCKTKNINYRTQIVYIYNFKNLWADKRSRNAQKVESLVYNLTIVYFQKVDMDENICDKDTATIEYVDSSLAAHSFSEKIGSTVVLFKTLKLKDSLFVWVGSNEEPKLTNLCVAMKSSYETLPLTTQVLGSRADETSTGLASQLTRRLSKPVFASVNLQLDSFLFPEVNKRLKEEIKNKPEYFW